MSSSKRTQGKLAIEQRRVRVAELYLRGWLQKDIGVELGVDKATVNRDLKALLAEWKQSQAFSIEEKVAAELEKLNALERTYWDGWERSVGTHQRKSAKKSLSDDGQRTETQLTEEEQVGDPRFLAGVMTCIEKRCKLLGLDAPEKHEVGGAGGQAVRITVVVPGAEEPAE